MVVKVHIEEVKGRKAIVSGRIEDLNGTVLVEASSTFVQPRYAKLLHSADLSKMMGESLVNLSYPIPSSIIIICQFGPSVTSRSETKAINSRFF